jgi:uncharacterized damage-inducible protein DinB
VNQPKPEPWLRGPLEGTHPLLAPLLYSFEQAREDLANLTAGLRDEDLHQRPGGVPSLAFQLRHIAGSVDRLATYLAGEQLSPRQMEELRAESAGGGAEGIAELLARIEEVFTRVAEQVRGMDPAALAEPRAVGRKALPTTVTGLLTHIAEHTQRHIGEAIVTAKILKSAR